MAISDGVTMPWEERQKPSGPPSWGQAVPRLFLASLLVRQWQESPLTTRALRVGQPSQAALKCPQVEGAESAAVSHAANSA